MLLPRRPGSGPQTVCPGGEQATGRCRHADRMIGRARYRRMAATAQAPEGCEGATRPRAAELFSSWRTVGRHPDNAYPKLVSKDAANSPTCDH